MGSKRICLGHESLKKTSYICVFLLTINVSIAFSSLNPLYFTVRFSVWDGLHPEHRYDNPS